EAALASLHESDAVARRIAHTRDQRERLYETLAGAGLEPIRSHGNFVYADVPGGDGDGLAERLLHKGFIVRELRGFGAPGAVRVERVLAPEPRHVARLGCRLERPVGPPEPARRQLLAAHPHVGEAAGPCGALQVARRERVDVDAPFEARLLVLAPRHRPLPD